jgi:hypothetical protein
MKSKPIEGIKSTENLGMKSNWLIGNKFNKFIIKLIPTSCSNYSGLGSFFFSKSIKRVISKGDFLIYE